jgi:hypothetical protein
MWISLFKTEGYIAKLLNYIVPIFRKKILHVVHTPLDKKQQYSIIGNNSRYTGKLLKQFYQGVFMLCIFAIMSALNAKRFKSLLLFIAYVTRPYGRKELENRGRDHR